MTPTAQSESEIEGESESESERKVHPSWIPTEDLIAELHRLTDVLGHPPRERDMNEIGAYAPRTYQRRFGTWNGGLIAAELEPNAWGEIPTEDLIEDMREFAADLGHSPTKKEMDADGPHVSSTYEDRFGTWNNGLIAAELEPNLQPVSTEEALSELRRVADVLGHTPTPIEYNDHASNCATTLSNRFLSWAHAVCVAGLDWRDVRFPSYDHMVEVLQLLAVELDRRPSPDDMDEYGPYPAEMYIERFDTWPGALYAAGLGSDCPVDFSGEGETEERRLTEDETLS